MPGPYSTLDQNQILQRTFDQASDELRVQVNGLVKETYDSIFATYPTTSSEVYTYKLDGVTVATVTVTYTDSSKNVLASVVRT